MNKKDIRPMSYQKFGPILRKIDKEAKFLSIIKGFLEQDIERFKYFKSHGYSDNDVNIKRLKTIHELIKNNHANFTEEIEKERLCLLKTLNDPFYQSKPEVIENKKDQLELPFDKKDFIELKINKYIELLNDIKTKEAAELIEELSLALKVANSDLHLDEKSFEVLTDDIINDADELLESKKVNKSFLGEFAETLEPNKHIKKFKIHQY